MTPSLHPRHHPPDDRGPRRPEVSLDAQYMPLTQSPCPEQSMEDLHLNGGSKVSVCSTTVGSAKDLAGNKKRERERGGLVVSYGMAMGWNNRMGWEAAH